MEDKLLLTVLEGIQGAQFKIVEVMNQMHDRMEASDLAMAKMIADSQRMIADSQRMIADTQGQITDTQRQIADNNKALAQILQYVIDVTTRTERMTSEVLTRLASPQGTSH
jgi:hypothetical protein